MKPFCYVLVFILLGIATASSECLKKVEQKNVVVFIDLNNSSLEVEDARKAACARGESFIRYPRDKKFFTKNELTKELALLAAQKKAVTSMIISGHDGGGVVHGDNIGQIDKDEIISAMKLAYNSNPDLLAEFKSVYMWGCWTMGPAEVDIWRKGLPSLKMAAGFINMGPLNSTEASHAVLRDLMIKEKKIIAETDQKKLKRAVAGVDDIERTFAAIYTRASCGEMYYYNTDGDDNENDVHQASVDNLNYTPGTHYVDYNSHFDCKLAQKDMDRNLALIMPYFAGRLALPKDTKESPVRKVYSFIRSHANCFKKNHVMNGDRIGLLRFYDELKVNFAIAFKKQIDLSDEALKHLDGAIPRWNPLDLKMKQFDEYLKEGKHKYFKPTVENLKNKSRRDIIKMIGYLDGMSKIPATRSPRFKTALEEINHLKNAMQIYLYEMRPECVSFSLWHETYGDFAPNPTCPI